MAPPVIKEFRLSMVYGRTVAEPLANGDAPSDGRLAFVRDRDGYAAWYATTRTQRAGAGDLTPPWPAHAEQGFWSRYLQEPDQPKRSLADVSGRQAFHKLVPVRVALPLALVAPLDEVTVTTEGFAWPWGVAFVVGLRHRHPLGLTPMAAAAVQLRDGRYATAEGDEKTLAEHADDVLGGLALEAFGVAEGVAWSDEPFTVHSTIAASGERKRFDPSRKDVHRILQAVTGFSATWKRDALLDLDKSRVAGRTLRPPDHIVFGLRRGRAVWAPESFLAPSGGTSSIGCQNRNLVIASMQTESLIGLVRGTAAHARAGAGLRMEHRSVARRVVGTLVRLWAGASIYRSGAVKAQVMDERYRDDINTVRAAVDQPAVELA